MNPLYRNDQGRGDRRPIERVGALHRVRSLVAFCKDAHARSTGCAGITLAAKRWMSRARDEPPAPGGVLDVAILVMWAVVAVLALSRL